MGAWLHLVTLLTYPDILQEDGTSGRRPDPKLIYFLAYCQARRVFVYHKSSDTFIALGQKKQINSVVHKLDSKVSY